MDSNARYIVLRDGSRVSERTHRTKLDAEVERDYWQDIVRKWPDGSVIRIETIFFKSRGE
jgi:hypothetical protein